MSKKTFCLIWSRILSVLFCVPSFADGNVTVSAKSAILLECSSGSVLFEKNADERLPMASTTKIMTALVAIEKCPLDRIVTATSVSCGIEGSSIYMREGEKFTMEELLYALLLASANDAACLIAEEVAGDIPSFAEMMNSKAAELGLSDTHFSNPHGLDAEDHYTSAYDLARLASAALSSPVFRTIVSTYRKNIGSGENTRHLLNHNRLLKMYDDALGVKTGYTRSSGRCLVSAAERDGVMLVAVTLSDPDDWRDHTLLLDHGFERCSHVTLAAEGSISKDLCCVGGDRSFVRCANRDRLDTVLPSDHGEIKTEIHLPHFLWASVSEGECVGEAVFTCDGKELGRLPLYAENSSEFVKKQSFFSKIIDLYR